MFSSISRSNVVDFRSLMAYCESLMNPQNWPLKHINLWSQEPSKAKSHRHKSLQNPKILKMFCSISQPNVNGFKLSIHQFKGLVMPVKIRYCRLKSVHVWQYGGHGIVGHMVQEMVILFSYCLGPFELRNLKNWNSWNSFCLISRPNL